MVGAGTYADLEDYTYGGLEAFTYGELEAATPLATVRAVSLTVNLGGTVLIDVISARGEVSADGGWPTCSVFVTTYPHVDNDPAKPPLDEETPITVVAGAGNNVMRFAGTVRRFRPSAFPKAIEIVCSGTLAYADEWVPPVDIDFLEVWPAGATDEQLVGWVLDQVPGITYTVADIGGTGTTLGMAAHSGSKSAWAFDWAGSLNIYQKAWTWKSGMSAWAYIQQLDRATLYRTYQGRDGTIRRVQMIGHPDLTEDFTLANADILEGASSGRDTTRTRNYVVVQGHDYGDGLGPVQGTAAGTNSFQGDGNDPNLRHTESYQSNLIESGVDPEDGIWDSNPGLRADDIAAAILPDVNKEFVEATVPSWRDDTHGPGLTCMLDCLARLRVGEKMWVARHAWEVGDNGWVATYGLTGGGLPQDYEPPPV